MYIENMELRQIKTFIKQKIDFIHPDMEFWPRKKREKRPKGMLPTPLLPNVNLIVGDNGSGKSTLLRSVAMTVMGPSFTDSKLSVQGLVRRGPEQNRDDKVEPSTIHATLLLHDEDGSGGERVESLFELKRRGELELVTFFDSGGSKWNPVFESKNPAFFSVGYGATRRVEPPENLDSAVRTRSTFIRGQRIQGLFAESFTLVPLETWLPGEKDQNRKRYTEVGLLLNRLIRPGAYRFSGKQERGVDFLFEIKGTKIPFRWLSDGYRAFIGWVGDLLYHAWYACPDDMELTDLRGIVLVDDIDLQLHPRWQMNVVKTVAQVFPRVQFIFTSHSPLVAGSVEWMNILTLKLQGGKNRTTVKRMEESIHGLDADQVLVSDFFGLLSTRSGAKRTRLDSLTIRARRGDDEAARQVIAELASGTEDELN